MFPLQHTLVSNKSNVSNAKKENKTSNQKHYEKIFVERVEKQIS